MHHCDVGSPRGSQIRTLQFISVSKKDTEVQGCITKLLKGIKRHRSPDKHNVMDKSRKVMVVTFFFFFFYSYKRHSFL